MAPSLTGENGVSPDRLMGGSRGASKAPGRPRAPSEPESRRDDGTGETEDVAETRRNLSRGRHRPDIRIQRAISETDPGSTGRGFPPLDLKTLRGKRGRSSALRGGLVRRFYTRISSPEGVLNCQSVRLTYSARVIQFSVSVWVYACFTLKTTYGARLESASSTCRNFQFRSPEFRSPPI